MRKTLKASTLRDNQCHDDFNVSIAAAIVLRNLTTPPNADEDGRVDSSSSQLVPPRLSTWKTKFSVAGNIGQRSPPKDGETQPNEWRRLIVALRRPAAKKSIPGERPPTDDRPSRRRRRTDNLEAAEYFINWYVGISCWSNGKVIQTTVFRHMTISKVLGCISWGRYRRRVVSRNMF